MNYTSVVMLGALCAALSACTTKIQHGLDEREANEVVTALSARGVAAEKVAEKGKKPSWSVEVREEDAVQALRLMAELKLPRPERSTTREVASHTALVETAQAERLRQLEAQEGDLEQVLEGLDGVTSAAVELVVPAPARPGQPTSPSKAAVLLRADSDAFERLEQQRQELKALVAGAVDGLSADDVVLVLNVVQPRLAPPKAAEAGGSLRSLAVTLGLALVLLTGLVVFLTLKVRSLTRARLQPPEPTTTPATGSNTTGSRPIINPAVQRKVA